MSSIKGFIGLVYTVLFCSVSFFPIQVGAIDTLAPNLSIEAIKKFTPDGYKVEKILPCNINSKNGSEFLVAFSDVDLEIPRRTVMLFLVAMGDEVVVEDKVILPGEGSPLDEKESAPNYLHQMTRENIGAGDLFIVWSVNSGGGSGAIHYFDCYRPEQGKLHLVKRFIHDRMERLYFAIFKGAIYDAELQCTRGEKHGNAYIYTCYLRVTKYVFNGNSLVPLATERLREKQGNRFLNEKYWCMSVLSALKNGEVFRQVQ
jgi:hypothetical protein